jgi:hypothetical protein
LDISRDNTLIRRKVSKKRKNFVSRHKLFSFFALAGVFALALVSLQAPESSSLPLPFLKPLPATASKQLSKPKRHKLERIVYPYSVIPGGVFNRGELAVSISNDPVIAAHYADFKINDAKITQATESELMYVSYRIKNIVFWTSKKIKIAKGETLITDGKKCARTRCGNMVSASAMRPVSLTEPADDAFDVPSFDSIAIPPLPDFDLAMLEFPNNFPRTGIEFVNPAPIPPIPVETPKSLSYNYRPLFSLNGSTIPEPTTFSLVAIGLGGLFLLRRLKSK